MHERIRSYSRLAARLLGAQSPQEREKRADHALALLLVCGVAIVKYVTGVTDHDAPFTFYALAVALSAARGGFEPALVAVLASILAGALGAVAPPETRARLVFAAEGLSIALLVSWFRARLALRETWLGTAGATIAALRLGDGHGRLLEAALRQLEDTAGETAVLVLDERGTIVEWRPSAERLYGYPAERAVGESAAALFFDPPTPVELSALLSQAAGAGAFRRTAVHRRLDGSPVDVELEVRPFRHGDTRAFTLTAHDTARRREWDDYREAATIGHAALREAADEARQQVAALENLTDPFLNPLGGAAMVTELLERLRATIRADGVALVQPGRVRGGVLAAGLQPIGSRPGAERPDLTAGRVAVVHNDQGRVEQLSSLRWPAAVASLLIVPVVHDGQVWSAIEVVSERPRQVGDWDVALVRIVADRLASVVVRDRTLAAAS